MAETDLATLRRREAELFVAVAAELTAMRTLRDLLLAEGQSAPELEAFVVLLSSQRPRCAGGHGGKPLWPGEGAAG